MSSLKRTIKLLTLALSLMLAFGARPAFAELELVINSEVIPTNTIVEGDPISIRMFRLAGSAAVMGMVKTGGGYEIRKAVDTMPVQGLEGKGGDVLSDGRWRFQVLSVETPESYAMKTDAEPYGYEHLSSFDVIKRIFTPKAGYTLVVIQCRATNTQKSQKRLWVAASDSSNVRTALTGMEGSSHAPIGYDFKGGPTQTKFLYPDETITFPVIFSVPQSTQLKELIFTLAANGEREESKDARVSMRAEQKDSAGPTNNGAGDREQKDEIPSAASRTTNTNDAVMTRQLPRRRPPAEPEYRELRCRGSSAMRIQVGEGRTATTGEQMMNMVVTIDPVSGPTDQSGSNLRPGQCAFADRTMPGAMPSLIQQEIVSFAQLRQQLHGSAVDTSPTAAERFPDAQNVPQYLKSPAHYWSFFVKNNGQGYFAASYGRFWKPSAVRASPTETKDRIKVVPRGDVYDRKVEDERIRVLEDSIANPPNSVSGKIRWKKDYGLVPLGEFDNEASPLQCGQFFAAAMKTVAAGSFGKLTTVAYTDFSANQMIVGPDEGDYHVCRYLITGLPLNTGLVMMAGMGGVLLLPEVDPSSLYHTTPWVGGSQPQPPPGYERVFIGSKSVILTDAAPHATVDFEMVYRPVSASPR